MPIVSTDDEARGLRYIFLGPVGYRLFEWTIPQWVTALLTLVAGQVVIYLFRPSDPVLWVVLALVPFGLAYLAAKRVRAATSPERGLIHHVLTLGSEVSTPRPEQPITTRTRIPSELFNNYREPTR